MFRWNSCINIFSSRNPPASKRVMSLDEGYENLLLDYSVKKIKPHLIKIFFEIIEWGSINLSGSFSCTGTG